MVETKYSSIVLEGKVGGEYDWLAGTERLKR